MLPGEAREHWPAHRMFLALKAGATPLRTRRQYASVWLVKMLGFPRACRSCTTLSLKTYAQGRLGGTGKGAHDVEVGVHALDALFNLAVLPKHDRYQLRVRHNDHLQSLHVSGAICFFKDEFGVSTVCRSQRTFTYARRILYMPPYISAHLSSVLW